LSGVFLLDVNVLIAAAWPTHQAHENVQQWLGRHARHGWATCPFTQCAFVRIVSNPVFSPNALTPAEGLTLLQANLSHPAHRFWEDDLSLAEAVEAFSGKIAGHRQVSDAYLLGLATHKNGKLATLDRSVLALLPDRSAERERIALI